MNDAHAIVSREEWLAARQRLLYERLHRGDVIRAANVASELGVNRRTLERDLAMLRELPDTQLGCLPPGNFRARSTPLTAASEIAGRCA